MTVKDDTRPLVEIKGVRGRLELNLRDQGPFSVMEETLRESILSWPNRHFFKGADIFLSSESRPLSAEQFEKVSAILSEQAQLRLLKNAPVSKFNRTIALPKLEEVDHGLKPPVVDIPQESPSASEHTQLTQPRQAADTLIEPETAQPANTPQSTDSESIQPEPIPNLEKWNILQQMNPEDPEYVLCGKEARDEDYEMVMPNRDFAGVFEIQPTSSPMDGASEGDQNHAAELTSRLVNLKLLTEVSHLTTLKMDQALVVNQTLRSGQLVRSPNTVLVLGDVNSGAEVASNKDVIVLGTIRGVVHAGAEGNQDSIIFGVRINPTQIRIANHIAMAPDSKDSQSTEPEVAWVDSGHIVIDPFRKMKELKPPQAK